MTRDRSKSPDVNQARPFVLWSTNTIGTTPSVQLGVAHFSSRANPSLIVVQPGRTDVLAHFKDDDCAMTFASALGLKITEHQAEQ